MTENNSGMINSSTYPLDAELIASAIADWASIESPSYDPFAVNQMMDVASSTMETLGATVERTPGADGYGDVVTARFNWGSTPGILVLGHLDTVHLVGTLKESLPIRRDGDRLYGPGVMDMKGGMYLSVHALGHVLEKQSALSVPVTFMFIPDEEIGSPSTRKLIEAEARKSRWVLVPEPAHDEKLVTGRHAFLRFTLTVFGKAQHAGVARGAGRSAISAMARLITQIEALSDIEREITYRVGVVSGGDFVNVVPTQCQAQVLCVAPTANAFHEIRQQMDALDTGDPELRVEVDAGPVRPLFKPTAGTLALYEIAASVAAELGLNLDHGQFGGGSDGNFTGALGIPTLDGLGVHGKGLHTKSEHIYVSSLVPRAQLLAGLYRALSKLAAKESTDLS
ncbi:MAG TPA: M20/M25/M40 family metallo-hydrolase [Gammaproteobacteria bacterium]|jgi:glutamate carboxypeptidase|nr:M20/M25/M40 family metallo-hydrolase [Gammaproteobacteria bacterium]HIB81105.1 M20/M25/M40 family metallo-hydrolase [Gammaproteobacteria bacterium]HIC21167.1 M20/M25/M40 family metallo-hydrolase [Gammaproteobacteria bacterium]HIN43460.1 M20/M25/M40 family metallo-hydrolase [Gammaproteobacteria bacterium]HIO17210.1 M20/M25/M40 family metallo-hydrolase [Gammaproteobacteria bacterium]